MRLPIELDLMTGNHFFLDEVISGVIGEYRISHLLKKNKIKL